MTTYTVEVSRKYVKSRTERFFDGQFWWDVDVHINGKYMYDLSGRGWAKTLEKAKAKALKHILSTEKTLDSDGEFGVIIKTSGTAEQVTKELE